MQKNAVEKSMEFAVNREVLGDVVEKFEFVDYRGLPGRTLRFGNGVQVTVTSDYHSGAKLALITNKPLDETYRRPWIIRTSPQWVYLNSHAVFGDMFRTVVHVPIEELLTTPPEKWPEGVVRTLNFLAVGAQSNHEDQEVRTRRDKALSHIGDVIFDSRLDQLQTSHELVELSQLVYFTCLGQGRAELAYSMIPILSRIIDFTVKYEDDQKGMEELRHVLMAIFDCEFHPMVGEHKWGNNGSFLVPIPKGWRTTFARGPIANLLADLMPVVEETADVTEQTWPEALGQVADRDRLVDELLILSLRLFTGFMKWMPEKKSTTSKPAFQNYHKFEGPAPQPMELVLGSFTEDLEADEFDETPAVPVKVKQTNKPKNKKAARQEKRVSSASMTKDGKPTTVKLSDVTLNAETTPADIVADLAESIGDPAYHEPASPESIKALADLVNQ